MAHAPPNVIIAIFICARLQALKKNTRNNIPWLIAVEEESVFEFVLKVSMRRLFCFHLRRIYCIIRVCVLLLNVSVEIEEEEFEFGLETSIGWFILVSCIRITMYNVTRNCFGSSLWWRRNIWMNMEEENRVSGY